MSGILLGLATGLNSCSSGNCCRGSLPLGLSLPERPKSPDASEAASTYGVMPRKYQPSWAAPRLRDLGFDPESGDREKPGVIRFRSKGADSSVANFHDASSEFNYFRSTAAEIKDGARPDSAYRGMARDYLKRILGEEKASLFSLTRMEKVRKGTRDDSIGRTVYYFGNFGMRIERRHVLGSSYGARVGIGGDDQLMHFSFHDPELRREEAVQVPTPAAVWDSLKRWQESRTRPACLRFAKHPDQPFITGFEVKQIFRSFVEVNAGSRPDSGMSGPESRPPKRLVPRVTTLVHAKLKRPFEPAKDQDTAPLPEYVSLHFHFPCTPSAGLCWPEGQDQAMLPSPVGTQLPQRP